LLTPARYLSTVPGSNRDHRAKVELQSASAVFGSAMSPPKLSHVASRRSGCKNALHNYIPSAIRLVSRFPFRGFMTLLGLDRYGWAFSSALTFRAKAVRANLTQEEFPLSTVALISLRERASSRTVTAKSIPNNPPPPTQTKK